MATIRLGLALLAAATPIAANADETMPILWRDIHLFESRADIEARYSSHGALRDASGRPWSISRGGMGQTVITGSIGLDCDTDVAVWFDTDGSEPGQPGEGGAFKIDIDFATELCTRPWPSLVARYGQPLSDRVYQIDDQTIHEAVWRDGERLIHLHDDEATVTYTAGRKINL